MDVILLFEITIGTLFPYDNSEYYCDVCVHGLSFCSADLGFPKLVNFVM